MNQTSTAGAASPITTLSRFNNRAALLTALQARLQARTHAREMQLMWQADGVTQSLFQDQPTLRLPTSREWLELAAGHCVEHGSISYLPMIVLGELRGWVALQSGQIDAGVVDEVLHAGVALALLESPAYQVTATREIAMMDKIGQLLSSTLQLDQLLSTLAAIVRQLVVAHSCYILLIDEPADEFSFAFYSSDQANTLPQQRWPTNAGLTGAIIRSGQPIVTDDYLTECRRRGIEPRLPANVSNYSHAWLGVPLRHHDRVLGVMVTSSNDPTVRYSAADVQLLSAVASQAAAAVANAQLYKRVQQQASQLAVINRIGRTISATLDRQQVPMLIMQELQAALDVEDGALLIQDHATGDLVTRYALDPANTLRIPEGAGLAGAALRLGTVQIADDMQQDERLYPPLDVDGTVQTHSMICAPLAGRQQLRGVIQLRNKRSGPFTPQDGELLAAVAEQAAVALENAELYSHADTALTAHIATLEQRNQQLSNIVTVSNALRSTNNMREVGQQIVSTIQSMTGSPRVVVVLVDAERQQVRAVAQTGFDPAVVEPRRERWIPLETAERAMHEATPIGTLTYRIVNHELISVFEDCIILALLDPSGMTVGMIAFDHAAEAKPLSRALIQELEIVANQAAIAIVNARLVSEQQQTVDRLTALNALSLAVTTSQLSTDEVMGMTVRGAIGTTNGVAGGAYVFGRDDTRRRLTIDVPAGSDEALVPLLELISDDYVELDEQDLPRAMYEAGVRSLLIVPVRGAKLALGGLWIGYNYTFIAPAEREMVVLYAKTAGAVLENLRLFDQVSEAHDRLASILASTTEGMLMVTAQGRIRTANASLAQLLSLPHDMLEGRWLEDLCHHPALAADYERFRVVCEALNSVANGQSATLSGEISLTAPTVRDLAWSVLPIRGNTQQQHAALLVLRDVTTERQTEKLRQDLANMIVHDLRAPLTNMMVSIDLLLKQISGPLTEPQRRIIQIAGDSSQQMLDLVNALLDIRRLEQRQLKLNRQTTELFELIESVFERLERVAAERGVELSHATIMLPPVSVDIDLIRRVLQNLIDNALKFSPRGRRVHVSGHPATEQELPHNHAAGRWVVIEIADEGPGVPDSYRGVIFELFGQAPQGRGQGTGLGLAFCKLAIAAHDGTIWVEDAPNGGALFRFTVPLA